MEGILMRCFSCFGVLTAVLALGTETAHAQGKYDLRHDFDVRLNARAGETYRGAWQWYSHARASSTVDGTDNGQPVVQSGSTTLSPFSTDFNDCSAMVTGAHAYSDPQYTAFANGTGFHQVTGNATTIPPTGTSSRAESGSAFAWNLGTSNRRGGMTWRPTWHVDAIKGGASGGFDPINFHIFDFDNGLIQDATLWNTGIDLEGAGTSTWVGGDLHIDGADGSFFLTMDSPYLTSGIGSMSVTFAGGKIVTSDDSGIFDGLLPAVGASSNGFDIPIGDSNGDIDMEFDFGPDNTNGFDMGVSFDTGGFAEATPEPATLVALGLGAIAVTRRRKKA